MDGRAQDAPDDVRPFRGVLLDDFPRGHFRQGLLLFLLLEFERKDDEALWTSSVGKRKFPKDFSS